jgi:hypothetical protein
MRSMARLIVLGMLLMALIPLARDEKTWRFFGPLEKTSQTLVRDTLKKRDKVAAAELPAAESPADVSPVSEPQTTEPPAPEPLAPEQPAEPSSDPKLALASDDEPGPTDLDPLEREAALEEFQAVSDRTLGIRPEEMGVYWRMFAWTKSQTFAEMSRRAKSRGRQPTFSDFVMSPDVQRGVLVSLKLNVRRVLEVDAPANAYGIEKVYELWGWTEDSQAWLYCMLTAELPPDMPIGMRVEETVRVTGYFFKLQGYLEIGAGPRDKPLAAPLLIGRVDWKGTSAGNKQTARRDWSWLWWIGGVAMVYLGLRLTLPRLFRGKGATSDAVAAPKYAGVGWLKHDEDRGELANWLSDAQSGKLTERPLDARFVDDNALNDVPPPITRNGKHFHH